MKQDERRVVALISCIVSVSIIFIALLIIIGIEDKQGNDQKDVANSETETSTEEKEDYIRGVYEVDKADEYITLRAEPSTSAEELYYIPNDCFIEIDEVQGIWGKVNYKNIPGWVNLDYCSFYDKPYEYKNAYDSVTFDTWQVNTDHDDLNLRSQPDKKSDIVGKVPKGTVLEITDYDDNWGYADNEYEDIKGWVNLDYCVREISMAGWVYVTKTGECYHTVACKYIVGHDGVERWHQDEAVEAGYRACKICGGYEYGTNKENEKDYEQAAAVGIYYNEIIYEDSYFFIADGDPCFHYGDGCDKIKGNAQEVQITQAFKKGLEPCDECCEEIYWIE